MHVAPPASPERFLGTEPDRVMRHPRLALVLLCLALWLPGFFTLPATDRDESRFAQATRQMVESGDHVRIRVGEEDRNKKPAGIHWLQSAAVHGVEALGLGDRRQIWPYRVPSLLGALLAVLATFEFGRALVGRRAALLGGAMLASCMVLVGEVHIAKTDAVLLATVTAAMGLFGLAYLRPHAFPARQAAGFWLVLGASVLVKGPIGPMVALLAGVTLAVADRGAPWLRALRPGWGIPLMLAAAAPWFIAIGIATGGRFFAEAVGEDMLAKVGSGEEKHWGPPGFYLAAFGISAFPAAFLVLLALPGAWAARLHPPTRFLLAWIVPAWLLFEAVQTKLPHYTLPTYPALMLLGAAWALHPLRGAPPRWLRWVALAALLGVAAGLPAAALAAAVWLRPAEGLGAVPGALLAVPAAGLLAWGVLRAWRRAEWGRAGVAAAVLAVPLYAAVLEGVAPRLAPLWVAPRLAAELGRAAPGLDSGDFGITGHAEPSVLFAVGGGTALLRRGEDAARFLAAAPGRRVVAVGDRALADFRREAEVLGLAPREVGTVRGFNYTRGRWVTLALFRGPA
jgi:4-amino-4-deoxy-L-arabinose transferase-like glycosyltransferase